MKKRSWSLRHMASLAIMLSVAVLTPASDHPDIRIASTDSVGPRTVEPQTKTSVVRDYLAAWKGVSRALAENRADLLDADFLGVARDKLVATVRDQQKLGLQTRYRDRKHTISMIFYSPEGLSIQLLDSVEYEVQILDHGKIVANQPVRARYLAVLTPTEVRWKVRIFQALPQ